MWEMGKSITRKSGPHSFRGTGCIGSSTKRSVENKVGILIDEISEFTCSQTGVLTPSSSLSLYGSQDSKQYFPRWPLMRQIHLYICDKKNSNSKCSHFKNEPEVQFINCHQLCSKLFGLCTLLVLRLLCVGFQMAPLYSDSVWVIKVCLHIVIEDSHDLLGDLLRYFSHQVH